MKAALDALVEQSERGEAITAADLGTLLVALGAAAFDARGTGAAVASLANMLREAGERLAPPAPAAAELAATSAAEPEAVAEEKPPMATSISTKKPRPPKAVTKKHR